MKLTKLKSSINVENDMHFTAAGRDYNNNNKQSLVPLGGVDYMDKIVPLFSIPN